MTTARAMTGDVVQIWLISTDLDDRGLAALEPLIDDAERVRTAAALSDERRRRFIAAHGAVRVIVGRKLAAPPERIRWRYGPHGKPELAWPATGLQVSLSHSAGLAALALCGGRRVGVDIERLAPSRAVTRLSERFYPPAEAEFVSAAGPASQVRRFTRLWTRKEACVKVTGGVLVAGLKLPVRGVGSVVAGDSSGSLPGPYLIRDVRVPAGFYAAVALEGDRLFRVRTSWWPDRGTAGSPDS